MVRHFSRKFWASLFMAVLVAAVTIAPMSASATKGAFEGVSQFAEITSMVYGDPISNPGDFASVLGTARNVRETGLLDGDIGITCVLVKGSKSGKKTLVVTLNARTDFTNRKSYWLNKVSMKVDTRAKFDATAWKYTGSYFAPRIIAQNTFDIPSGNSPNFAFYDGYVMSKQYGRQEGFFLIKPYFEPLDPNDPSKTRKVSGKYSAGITCYQVELNEVEEDQFERNRDSFIKGIKDFLSIPIPIPIPVRVPIPGL